MIPINLFTITLFAGFFQSIFLILALRRIKDRNRKANQYLIYFIALISLALIGRLSYLPGFLEISMKLAMFPDFILFLFGPLLLFYFRNLLLKEGKYTSLNWKYFIPAFLHLIYAAIVLSIENESYTEKAISGQFNFPIHIVLVTSLTHTVLYWALSLKLVLKYVNENKQVISYRVKGKYLFSLLGLTGLCLLIWAISEVLSIGGFGRPDFQTYSWVWIGLTFIVYSMGYYAMNQPELFKLPVVSTKYQSSKLSSQEIKSQADLLDQIMKEEKLYRLPKLSRQDLELKLKINSADMSRIINEGFSMNFFDFVNSYRIREFLNLVSSEELRNYTMVAVAKEAGFNSKTTFNTAFKKQMGMTPKEYLTMDLQA